VSTQSLGVAIIFTSPEAWINLGAAFAITSESSVTSAIIAA
jgi:hypothetical protein